MSKIIEFCNQDINFTLFYSPVKSYRGSRRLPLENTLKNYEHLIPLTISQHRYFTKTPQMPVVQIQNSFVMVVKSLPSVDCRSRSLTVTGQPYRKTILILRAAILSREELRQCLRTVAVNSNYKKNKYGATVTGPLWFTVPDRQNHTKRFPTESTVTVVQKYFERKHCFVSTVITLSLALTLMFV